MPFTSGSKLGTYEIISLLGAGGMGEVYRARDSRLGRDVAIKVLPADRVVHDEDRRRFLQEARAASALNHPNIVTIHEIESAGDVDFIVMEYVPGTSLHGLVSGQGMPAAEVVRIAVTLADALGRAHARGIIHRDLKPANVMIGPEGVVKILDFGLAKVRPLQIPDSGDDTVTQPSFQGPLTEVGTISGTVGYMSPEQATGKPVDHRTDIFSFGAMLYEMATGCAPFRGASTAETLAALLTESPQPPSALAAVPVALEQVILKCLQKDPAARFQHFEEVARALHAAPSALPAPVVAARPPRRLVLAGALALVAVAALVAGVLGWRTWGSSRVGDATTNRRFESVAVLPFANSSVDPELEYVGDGLTENIINNIARLQRVRVVPRSTVFSHKGKIGDAQALGRSLEVGAVLTGRVTRKGDTLAIAVELIDIGGRSQIWGTQYTRRADDLQAIETEITREVAARLGFELTADDRRRLAKGGTQSVEAYDFYLRGLYHLSRPRLEGLKEAIGFFERAAQADPGYALPHAGLSDVYGMLGYLALGRPQEIWPKAKAEALKALTLDSELASAHAALGHAILFYDWDWPAAKQELDRAIALDPNGAPTYHWYAHYWMTQNNWDRAIEASRKAVELEPLNLFLHGHLSYFLAATRQPDQLREQARKAALLDPEFWVVHTGRGLAHLLRGELPESIPLLEKANERSGGLGIAMTDLGYAYALGGHAEQATKVVATLQTLASRNGFAVSVPTGVIHAGLRDKDRAFAALERAYVERDPMLLFLKAFYWFDNLRDDARHEHLIARIGLR
jgi:TolB-like protein/tRNA A-37 threonylcarbamoyl transferase component Bud32/Flp pilus assembly protein TadD